jgi:hypothetical protein
MGEQVKDNVIQSNIWNAVDALMEARSSYSNLLISAMIDPPAKDEHADWELHLSLIRKERD